MPQEPARSRLISVASGGLGGGGLGLGGNDPLLVKSLEERLDDGTISDLSALKRRISPNSGVTKKGNRVPGRRGAGARE